MTAVELGESLKRFRKNYKLSQEEMAKDMGVSRTMYQAYEGGKSAPSIIFLTNLADAHNVSLDYLTGRKIPTTEIKETAVNAINENLTIEERVAKLEAAVAKFAG